MLFHLGNHRNRHVHELVERLNEGEAEDTLPKAVGDDGGEARILRAGHPTGVGLQRRLAGLADAVMAHHGTCADDGLRLRIAVLVIMREGELRIASAHAGVAHGVAHIVHGFLVAALLFAELVLHLAALRLHDFHVSLILLVGVCIGLLGGGTLFLGHLTTDFRALRALRLLHGSTSSVFLLTEKVTHISHDAAIVVLSLHTVGEGGHFEELHLGPFIEGMIVALSALDASAEEDARGVRHVIERHAAIPHVIADGTVLPCLPLRGDHLGDELVVGLVVTKRLLHEVRISRASDRTRLIAIAGEAQHIRPVIEEVLHIGLGAKKLVDELRTLVGSLVIEECLGLACGGNTADGIEVNASDEGVVVGGRIAGQFVFLPIRRENRINDSGGRLYLRSCEGSRGEAEESEGGGERALHAAIYDKIDSIYHKRGKNSE